MSRDVLLWCLPYLALLVASLAALRMLAWISGVKMQLRRVVALHADQRGGVQSLSFVLTLPLFAMIVMFIVQLSQLMIARTVVEYAGFAAARSAVVWIPANLASSGETENRIASLQYLGEQPGSDGQSYSVYQVVPRSAKYDKIQMAAAMAVLPVCPSRDTGVSRDHPGNAAYSSLVRAYLATAPSQAANTRVPNRMANKLAYALANTNVRIEVHHKESEPPLAFWDVGPYNNEFAPNEIGWQDQIFVTVSHNFALLPGPGRLLASSTTAPAGAPASTAPTTSTSGSSASGANDQQGGSQAPTTPSTSSSPGGIGNQAGTFVYTLTSTVRLNNEGEKSVLPYVQTLSGLPATGLLPPPPDDANDATTNSAQDAMQNATQPCVDCAQKS